MENPTEFFRKTLNEFRAADDLLSKQLKRSEDQASEERIEITTKTVEAERVVADCLRVIVEDDSSTTGFSNIQISPQLDSELAALKNLEVSVSGDKKALDQINHQIESLKKELQAALLKEQANRRKKIIRRTVTATAAVCALIVFHFWLLSRTTLSFVISVDGKPPSADRMPNVTLDGKPFANGGRMNLGHHHLSVELKDFEPVQKDFWAFYGAKDLGTLSLEFYKGSVNLLSDPPDAEFELSGNGRHWQGKLPIRINNVPVGIYQSIARRKGWELNGNVAVNRGSITTNTTVFQYGSIEVTSDPSGLAVSTNGVNIGKTPMTFREVIPGRYTFTVSDGENDLTADIGVAPKEAAKRAFVFHYGNAHLSSTPPGATVIRKGKEIGKTPLTLNHIPVGETTVELQLQDYVSTNFSIQVVEGATTNLSAKLTSERYVQAMKQARDAFDAEQFTKSQKFLAIALQAEPKDSAAIELQDEVSKSAANAEEAKKEAEHEAEIARKEAAHQEIVGIIEKAINAVGGRDAINRFQAFKEVSRATGEKDGKSFSMRTTVYIQLPDRIRKEQVVENQPKKLGPFTLTTNGGRPTTSIFCVTETGSWEILPSLLGPVEQSVSPGVQDGFRENLYESYCTTLIPLLSPDYTLEKISDPPSAPSNTVAIKVHKDGRPDLTLYFNIDSGLLAGIDTENSSERYSEYRNFSGLICPTVTTYVSGGKTSSVATLESLEPFDPYYGNVFSPPTIR